VNVVISWFVVVLWMGMMFALSAVSSLASPLPHADDFIRRQLAHLTVYAVLTILLCRALRQHVANPTHAWRLAGLVAGVYASSDAWHQLFVPGRHGSLRDVGIQHTRPIEGVVSAVSRHMCHHCGADGGILSAQAWYPHSPGEPILTSHVGDTGLAAARSFCPQRFREGRHGHAAALTPENAHWGNFRVERAARRAAPPPDDLDDGLDDGIELAIEAQGFARAPEADDLLSRPCWLSHRAQSSGRDGSSSWHRPG
jgi:VanZ family protein